MKWVILGDKIEFIDGLDIEVRDRSKIIPKVL